MNSWLDAEGVLALPGGAQVRGRALSTAASAADFALVLADGPLPEWPYRRVRWPDFWVPMSRKDALAALSEAHERSYGGERVEVCCRGGIGRTGTALAALAVMDGLTPRSAIAWVRARYHPRAVETAWQKAWLHLVR